MLIEQQLPGSIFFQVSRNVLFYLVLIVDVLAGYFPDINHHRVASFRSNTTGFTRMNMNNMNASLFKGSSRIMIFTFIQESRTFFICFILLEQKSRGCSTRPNVKEQALVQLQAKLPDIKL